MFSWYFKQNSDQDNYALILGLRELKNLVSLDLDFRYLL